jgi:methylthioribose-1-phosphate isomerase
MRTISWREESGGFVRLLDQTKLPQIAEEIDIKTHEELISAIKSLAVRGAPALGVAGALGVALIVKNAEAENWSASTREKAIVDLRNARPTAVNLAWGVDQALQVISQGSAAVLKRALEISDEDAKANRAMGKRGGDFLANLLSGKSKSNQMRLLTHCNTGALATTEWGTALGVIRDLFDRGLVNEVFADETRPLLQGSRLTAWELSQLKIPYRILPDGAAASAIFSGLIDAVLIGADRIAKNGDTANKIGSLSVAVAAAARNVPFLVVAPESTIDRTLQTGAEIEIEFRSDSEVTQISGKEIAPAGSKSYNPAFDVTPAQYITAIITEKAVYQPMSGEML